MPRQRPPPDHIVRRLGKLLQQHRRARGLTQHELADVVGLAHTTYENYEQAFATPPYEVLICICNHLDVPLSVFFAPLDDITVPVRTIGPQQRTKYKKAAR